MAVPVEEQGMGEDGDEEEDKIIPTQKQRKES
jgi:hypothetical protein